MFRTLLTAFFAASLIMLSGMASAAMDKAPIRIAMIDPLTGSFASMGTSQLAFFKFEANRLNQMGGINGHKIEIIGLDNKINPQQALVQLQKAIDDGIQYIAQANGSSIASALINAVNKHNQRNPDSPVLYLNYGAVDAVFTNERCSFWHFRFDANASMKMNSLTDWIADQKNIHKIFLINQDYIFGHSVSKEARAMLKKKRPDIEFVGDVFVPLGKVKDFSPYVSQIKASGADAVITGNWGPDMSLLAKAAANYGLTLPFLTYYADLVGTPSAIGKAGVDIVHLISIGHGDYKNAELAKREVAMKKKTGYDYGFIQIMYTLDMLKQAAEKADSIDPVKVAYALEGLQFDGPMGAATMRAKDHQIEVPLFLSVFTDNMKYSIENTDHLNFHALETFSAEQTTMPTTCQMKRPKQ